MDLGSQSPAEDESLITYEKTISIPKLDKDIGYKYVIALNDTIKEKGKQRNLRTESSQDDYVPYQYDGIELFEKSPSILKKLYRVGQSAVSYLAGTKDNKEKTNDKQSKICAEVYFQHWLRPHGSLNQKERNYRENQIRYLLIGLYQVYSKEEHWRDKTHFLDDVLDDTMQRSLESVKRCKSSQDQIITHVLNLLYCTKKYKSHFKDQIITDMCKLLSVQQPLESIRDSFRDIQYDAEYCLVVLIMRCQTEDWRKCVPILEHISDMKIHNRTDCTAVDCTDRLQLEKINTLSSYIENNPTIAKTIIEHMTSSGIIEAIKRALFPIEACLSVTILYITRDEMFAALVASLSKDGNENRIPRGIEILKAVHSYEDVTFSCQHLALLFEALNAANDANEAVIKEDLKQFPWKTLRKVIRSLITGIIANEKEENLKGFIQLLGIACDVYTDDTGTQNRQLTWETDMLQTNVTKDSELTISLSHRKLMEMSPIFVKQPALATDVLLHVTTEDVLSAIDRRILPFEACLKIISSSSKDKKDRSCQRLADALIRTLATEKPESKLQKALKIIYTLYKTNQMSVLQTECQTLLCKALLLMSAHVETQIDGVQSLFECQMLEVKQSLLKLMTVVTESSKNPSWLYCVPLYRLSSSHYEPFETTNKDDNFTNVEWWGIKDIQSAKDAFKNRTDDEWLIPLETIIRDLAPLFKLDFHLPRCIIASLNVFEIKEVIPTNLIPREILCAVVAHYMGQQGYRQIAILCLEDLVSSTSIDNGSVEQLWISCKISEKIYTEERSRYESVETACIVVNALYLFVKVVSDFFAKLHEEKRGTLDDSDMIGAFNKVIADITKWMTAMLEHVDKSTDVSQLIQVWNNVCNANVHRTLLEHWNEAMTSQLIEQTSNVCDNFETCYSIDALYFNEDLKFSHCVEEVLRHIIFVSTAKGRELKVSKYKGQRLIDMLQNVFDRDWKLSLEVSDYPENSRKLRFLLRWNYYITCLRVIDPPYKDAVQESVQEVKRLVRDLQSGEILVEHLKLIHTHLKDFLDIVEETQSEKCSLVEGFIRVRMTEYETFSDQLFQINEYRYLWSQFKNVDPGVVDQQIRQIKDGTLTICDVCEPIVFTVDMNDANIKPKLTCVPASHKFFKMMNEYKKLEESKTFLRIWNQECQCHGHSCTKIDDISDTIWPTVNQKWNDTCKCISEGTGRLKWCLDTFIPHPGISREDIEKEFSLMSVRSDVVATRIRTITEFSSYELFNARARTISKLINTLHLEGDFDQFHELTKHDLSEIRINKLAEETVLATFKEISCINQDQNACLERYLSCPTLIEWIREIIADLKELKVFVDLALISAGDEPKDTQSVRVFHASITGYAPLIFDLPNGYTNLMSRCKLIWRELGSNTKLPEQLTDTCEQLGWFKWVKDTHGSVAVNSLRQAEAINENGVYTICKDSRRSINEWDIEYIVTLEVERDELKQTRFSFNQLKDLQGRLMLVAGPEGNRIVDEFTMIFDHVTRLAAVYKILCKSGCLLYEDWNARIYCNAARPVCVELRFLQTTEMKGRKTGKEGLAEVIAKIATFMEKRLDEWLIFIRQKRKQYHQLNYFTIEQLVILQRQLVQRVSDDEQNGTEEVKQDFIYPLLSAVIENCTKDDLFQSIVSARERLMTETAIIDFTNTTDLSDTGSKEENAKRNFIQELVNAGYELQLVLLALKNNDPDDTDAGILWCMENEDNDELQVDQGWNQSDSSLQTLLSNGSSSIELVQKMQIEDQLVNELRYFWEQFKDSIKTNTKDYISLDHLGIILQCLAEKDTRPIERNLPPVFIEGEPNLVFSPSGDVLYMLLAIYMQSGEESLPYSHEVLLCSATTTKDEVDIFWRRAFRPTAKGIFCLAHIEKLEFDVSDAAERYLEEHLLGEHPGPGYRLIVICSSEKEFQSRLASALDKFRRPAVQFDREEVKKYVQKILETKEENTAAAVDFERSTVRVVVSTRPGLGKSLYKKRREEALHNVFNVQACKGLTIPLYEKTINEGFVFKRLTTGQRQECIQIVHIDLAHEVQMGVDHLLFQMFILGYVMDRSGRVWRKSFDHFYIIENMPLQDNNQCVHVMIGVLPTITCWSPSESLKILKDEKSSNFRKGDQTFDQGVFESRELQRTFQYLKKHEERGTLRNIDTTKVTCTKQECLEVLLRYCGVEDPTWAELHHFISFINNQLVAFESNVFVCAVPEEDLPGFSTFVLRFLIQMSKDFSSRSLDLSEQSSKTTNDKDLQMYQMRRTWESSPHPYLFFNSDNTFTFVGFHIDRNSGNMTDLQTDTILETGVMKRGLYDALVRNKAPIKENFNELDRNDKIKRICKVMGVENPSDVDRSYELTTDNAKKILAIYMRFRCNIPVIIMGETGCGKTRLVKFLCDLQCPKGEKVTNMILMKVHGGTTNGDIIKCVREAEDVAKENVKQYGTNMYTVLFFDEANTTESIGLIKEILCDRRLEGDEMQLVDNLKIVAACNPYRKHSEEMIKKLEQAGLGYHVDVADTADMISNIPMRHLVYRVQPLPQSLLPLVWDFGQLDTDTEKLYIRQMVRRYVRERRLPAVPYIDTVISEVLTESQNYMRRQKDECSYVSLRDVERALSVMCWFKDQTYLYRQMNESMEMKDKEQICDESRSLILAIGLCYHACLKDRSGYRKALAPFFKKPCPLPGGPDRIESEIQSCQDIILANVKLEQNIARNMALKENVCMMVVCIELRIPLFLVGKPGSSKSLAKVIVSDELQGSSARTDLFRTFKQVQMVSFQCSPLSTPEGIISTFRQCAQLQKDKDLNQFVSVVVLDEIGLAEDSKRMPLKTLMRQLLHELSQLGLHYLQALHPLLEDGCTENETPEPYKKVGFIGISNWSLDPAKMNRGILVQRDIPDRDELVNTARGICSKHGDQIPKIERLLEPLADAYLGIFEESAEQMREFFGLRDFYSLIKMAFSFMKRSGEILTWNELEHSIKRNFGGLDKIDPVRVFDKHLGGELSIAEKTDLDNSASGLIKSSLFNTNCLDSESRYLLLLTVNYGALSVLQLEVLKESKETRPTIIFGSSFKSDQEYTQICRNINKIKVCMETGCTVILLNLENLYESLYDALNQYYVYYSGERYVDLGLGTHRVKCPVHKDFRLIVVAEKTTVYEIFPIPLINRLEKHLLSLDMFLNEDERQLVQTLIVWTTTFAKGDFSIRNESRTVSTEQVFMGFHEETISSIVHEITYVHQHSDSLNKEELEKMMKNMLLNCATPDAIIRFKKEFEDDIYMNQQFHESLDEFLNGQIQQIKCKKAFFQISTHSKLLANIHGRLLAGIVQLPPGQITILDTLQSFSTEQQFCERVRQHLIRNQDNPAILVVQSNSGDEHSKLIECARYCIMDEVEKSRSGSEMATTILFIIQLRAIARGRFNGFQCGTWQSIHIDDLWNNQVRMPSLKIMKKTSMAEIFANARESTLRVHENPSNEGLDCNKLILSCVVPALSMVRDSEADMTRMTQRLSHIVDRRGQNISRDESRFLEGVSLVISDVWLRKQWELEGEHMASTWIQREACKLENIHNAGSFRQACLHAFQKKLTPLLADVIAVLDTNSNIEILRSSPWKRKLWLSVINIKGAIQIEVSDLQVSEQGKQAVVGCTGFDHKEFKSSFPFSWLVFRTVNDILALALKRGDSGLNDERNQMLMAILLTGVLSPPDNAQHVIELILSLVFLAYHLISTVFFLGILLKMNIHITVELSLFCYLITDDVAKTEMVNECVTILATTTIGQLLSQMQNYNELNEAFNDYTTDFVRMRCKVSSEKEFEIVCNEIHQKAEESLEHIGNGNLLHRIVLIHVTNENHAKRLHLFSDLNAVCADWNALLLLQAHPCTDITVARNGLLIDSLAPDANGTDPKTKASAAKELLNNEEARHEWLERVRKYKGVIENVISEYSQESDRDLQRHLLEQRQLWNGVLCVKLFVEHMCTGDHGQKISIEQCHLLWKLLGKKGDLRQVKSIENVEQFLKVCKKKADTQYSNMKEKCAKCEIVLKDDFIVLQCNHRLCDEHCKNDLVMNRKCPVTGCKISIEQNWKPHRESGVASISFKEFQRRCNMFYMDALCQLCFSNKHSPSEDIVDKMLDYVFFNKSTDTKRKGETNVFDLGLDATPTFRGFLLTQLIESCNTDDIRIKLSVQLKRCKHLNIQDYSQTCKMIRQAFENTKTATTITEENRVSSAIEDMRTSLDILTSTSSEEIYILQAVAHARTGLQIAAEYVAKAVLGSTQLAADEMILLERARIVCDQMETNAPYVALPKLYLIRILCNAYSKDLYRTLCKSSDERVNWIWSDHIQLNDADDRYIITGKLYEDIKHLLISGSVSGNLMIAEILTKAPSSHVTCLVYLALHRLVACTSLLSIDVKCSIKAVSVKILHEVCDKPTIGLAEEFCKCLSEKGFRTKELNVEEELDYSKEGIQCLIVHFMCVLRTLPDNISLVTPLASIAKTPEKFEKAFLPTMPLDETERFFMENKEPFYRCPNDHPYSLGQCGRPWVTRECPICGETIGGAMHKLTEGNKDCTKGYDYYTAGHILGCVKKRPKHPTKQRKLDVASCACLMLFGHMAMLIGAETQLEGISALIKPTTDTVSAFLWDHICRDIGDIRHELGKSMDDVLILMHVTVNNIMTLECRETINEDEENLSTMSGRESYEEKFCREYIQPVLQNMNAILEETKVKLKDSSHACDTEDSLSTFDDLQYSPAIWQYTTRISLVHLRQSLKCNKAYHAGKYRALDMFLEEEPCLRAICYIPNIMRLHRLLYSRLNGRIGKTDAKQIPVGELKEMVQDSDFEGLLNDYCRIWEIVRDRLRSYSCQIVCGKVIVPDQYCSEAITMDSPVAMLLPSMTDKGICSYALLDFLFRKQNEVLVRTKREIANTQIGPTVSPMKVIPSQLICFDTQRDIIPVVLANCTFSLDDAHSSDVMYDFDGIERQIIDRFISSKSMIEIEKELKEEDEINVTIDTDRSYAIETMSFAGELTSVTVFGELEKKIPQKELSQILRNQISSDMNSLPEVCQSLFNLEVTIAFLKTVGGRGEDSLNKFMLETLKMQIPIGSAKARQACRFEHSKSLWQMLMLIKSKINVYMEQPKEAVFEAVGKQYFTELPEGCADELNHFSKQLTIEQLEKFVQFLHVYILFVIAIKENPEDADYTGDRPIKQLREWLPTYVDEFENEVLPGHLLYGLPDAILNEHVVHVWIVSYQILKKREYQEKHHQ